MPIRVVRLGNPRFPGEGLRLGTVRRPPRGVPKAEFASRNFYDVWLPDLAPSEELLREGHHATDERAWRRFVRHYRMEMKRPEAVRLLALLAALSRQTDFSVGCYCADEGRCHRTLLRELLAEQGAELLPPDSSSTPRPAAAITREARTTPSIPTRAGDRLILRPFTPADAPDVQRLAGERAIADTTAAIPHPYEDGMAEAWIAGHGPEFEQGRGVTFAVTRKEDGVLVGAVSLMGIRAGHQAELGYWIGTPYWNLGYCTEAARLVLGYAFTDLGLWRVHACHFSRNPSSGRVLQKLAMRHEGCLRGHLMKWDRPEDLEVYGVMRHEWQDSARPGREGG